MSQHFKPNFATNLSLDEIRAMDTPALEEYANRVGCECAWDELAERIADASYED